MFLERDNVSSYCERSVFGSDFGLLDYDGVVSGRDEEMSGRDEAVSGRDEAVSGSDHARASPANAMQYQCLQDCGFFEGAHGGQVSRLTSNGLRPQASDWEPTPRKAGPRAKFQTTKSDRLLVDNNTSNSKNSSTAPETALRA